MLSTTTINKGIFIYKKELSENEFLVTFLTTEGQLTLFAQGLNKPTSKNAANLIYGALCEFEYFQARQTNKVGRLKKATLLFKYELGNEKSFTFLSRVHDLVKNIHFQNEFINIYLEIVSYINDENFYQSFNCFLKALLKYYDLSFNLTSCLECSNTDVSYFDFKIKGFLCSKHSTKSYSPLLLERLYILLNDTKEYVQLPVSEVDEIIYYLITSFCLENNLFAL